jgi:hypothetical protein
MALISTTLSSIDFEPYVNAAGKTVRGSNCDSERPNFAEKA